MANNGYFCEKLAKMFKYTKHTLKKIETLFSEMGYTIRYEKGNFNSGYCIVENRKIAVINKFFDTEGRINCLLEIFQFVEDYPMEDLTEASAKVFKQLEKMQKKKPLSEETEVVEEEGSQE